MRALASVSVLIVLSACGDSVVGGACRPGFEARGGRCVTASEPFGDGGAIDPGTSDGGASHPDASSSDGGVGVHADASNPPVGTDAGELDAGAVGPVGPAPACDLGELECGGGCVDPASDRDHCGGCGTACGASEVCAAGACVSSCAPPLTMCGAICTDTSTDPDHCGACGNRCASGICEAGECVAGVAGHLVVVGHDYRVGRRGMNRIAGNAVFLASGAPVRVLAFDEASPASVVHGVDSAVDQVAAERGRAFTKSVADADTLTLQLVQADVLVIYPQSDATDDRLRELGARWSLALESFLRRGGVVVLFDGPSAHAGTWQILDEAGLFEASGRVTVSGDVVRVVSPADAVAPSVPLSYRGETSTVRFETSETEVVVAHDDGPVVVHRVFAR